MNEQELLNMKVGDELIHSIQNEAIYVSVIRVFGGWIYTFRAYSAGGVSTQFIPELTDMTKEN